MGVGGNLSAAEMNQMTQARIMAQMGAGGGGGGNSAYQNAIAKYLEQMMAAMPETQRRAAEDRAKAISMVQQGMTEATQGPAYGQWSALVNSIAESPETITPEVAAGMYEEARIPAEAQTQKLIRDIQGSYYSRGVPGGAMQSAIEQAQIGKMGTLSSAKRNIALERAKRKREDLTSAAGTAGTLAQYYGNTRMAGASTLADILGNTISAVPGGMTLNVGG